MSEQAASVPTTDSIERVWYHGQCHCGGVKFSAAASRNLTITLCNCGICYKSGHQELMIPEERFELHQGQEFLKPYRFGNKIADHTFCAVCGIMPFYRPRSHPTGFFSVNARCLDLGAAVNIEYVEFDGQNWEESIAAGKHVLTE
ncbi:aldehyde-activating protein [Streptomyces sp. PBH53]|uniref:GFA family protein n=1 Tax=Streptomyces sp. PBH53 TaxID=1577075 RepID=UPI000656389D|nr:GFA family protein [Streptomyces sp. PBH53]AKN70375.1 aldehyde-activating protein [Streptomyces sp. PBH53]